MENELIMALKKQLDELQDKVDKLSNERITQDAVIPQAIKSRHLQSGIELNSPIITLGSDATGDIYYRDSSGAYTRRAIGSTGQVLKVVAGLPSWSSLGASVTDEDITGTSITSSATYANITGADVSLTTTVTSNILLIASVQAYANIDLAPYTITWHDGTTTIGGSARIYLRSSNPRTTVTIHTIATNKVAGTYTYTVQHKSEDGSTSCTAETFSGLAIAIPV